MEKSKDPFGPITRTISKIYEESDFRALQSTLEDYLNKEKTWTDQCLSDGFYLYSQVKNLIERAMTEENTDMISFLLSFQNRHFDSEFMEAAQDNEMDLEFGLKERTPIYYSPGSEIELGIYHFAASDEAPEEPVRWEVLDLEEDRALLISKYVIDCRPYHDTLKDMTWEECSLRTWLNNDFYQHVFTPDEQDRIMETKIHTEDVSTFIKGGKDTLDRIFLLSIEEVRAYFSDPSLSLRKATPYVGSTGTADSKDTGFSWFLRSPGSMWMSTACIDGQGQLNDGGVYVQDGNTGLCPALWIRI